MQQTTPYQEHQAYNAVMLRRFFECFQGIDYRGVAIGSYLYSPFIRLLHKQWNMGWGMANLPNLQAEMEKVVETDLFRWFDEPYRYEAHPDGIILLPEKLVRQAAQFLSPERYRLIDNLAHTGSKLWPNENWLTLDSDFEKSENQPASQQLLARIAGRIRAAADDPIMGSDTLLSWFKQQVPGLVRIIDALHHLFDLLKIGAVVTLFTFSYENQLDNALILVAKSRQIPSLALQYRMIGDSDLFGHLPLLAAKKLVWGSWNARWYQKYGYPASRLAVVGCPSFDAIFQKKWGDKAQLCEWLQVDPERKIAILTTQPQSVGKQILPLILEGLAKLPEVFLAVLIHPLEIPEFEDYQKLTAGFSNCRVYLPGKLYQAFSGADLVFTGCSTTALEALLFGLPVITVEAFEMDFSYRRDANYALGVTTADEITQLTRELLNNAAFRETVIRQCQTFIADYVLGDGKAGQRLFAEIEQICHSEGIN